MTLALYGKSRKRQGLLVFGALLAVMLGLMAALWVARDASAVVTEITPSSASCSDDGDTSNDDCDDGDETARLQSDDGVAVHLEEDADGSGQGDDDLTVVFSLAGIPAGSTINDVDVRIWATVDTSTVNMVEVGIVGGSNDQEDDYAEGAAGNPATFQGSALFISYVQVNVGGSASILVSVDCASGDGDCSILLDKIALIVDYTEPADDDGDGVPNGTDQCPGTPGDADVDAGGCSFGQRLAQLTPGTSNPGHSNICAKADFSFVVDRSGSVSTDFGTMMSGISTFAQTYNGGGDGLFSLVTFRQDTDVDVWTAGYVDEPTFSTAALGISNPDGLTPTQAGIQAGDGTLANDRNDAPNVMIIVTDGAPNVPTSGLALSNPTRWINAANGAVGAANTARTVGGGNFDVIAVYIGNTDPDLATAFGSAANADTFATTVMTHLGGGSFQPANFASLATDILNSLDCQEPETFDVEFFKVVCDAESKLPNWAEGQNNPPANINANTADSWVDTHPGCAVESWTFAVADTAGNIDNPGDNNTSAGTGFSPYATGSVHTLPILGDGTEQYRVREVFQTGYVPFSGQNTTEDVSAEFYCNDDVANFDNYEWISPDYNDGQSYCVAFNAEVHKLILKKAETSGAVPSEFDFEIRTWDEDDLLDSGDGTGTPATGTIAEIVPGEDYHIIEIEEPGWVLGGVTCVDGGQNVITPQFNAAEWSRIITIPQNVVGDVTCTFTNRPANAEIHAVKIVCDDETDLPNWGAGLNNPPAVINEAWVTGYTLPDGCSYDAGWQFQYEAISDGQPWLNFPNLTDANGHTSFTIDAANLSRVEIREVLQSGYIPFSDDNSDPVSAELYCDDDVAGYDNLEWIQPISNGNDYWCVAWNVEDPGVVGLDKSQSGDGSYNIGEKFDFVLTFKVTDGNTNAVTTATDDIPGVFDIVSVAGPHEGGITCQANGQQVTCDLPSGTAPGNYDAFITVKANGQALCEDYQNVATISGENANTEDNGDETVSINCANVVATKIVCPAESYFPDAGDGSGADGVAEPIVKATADDFLTANPDCSTVPWTFEYQWGGSNPGDNLGDTALTNFASDVPLTFPIQHDTTLWVREQKPADYVDFFGVTTDTPQFSAEMYCSADTIHYDNWERIESNTGQSNIEDGETYYCVGFNTLKRGTVVLTKYENIGGADTWDFSASNAQIGGGAISYPMPNNPTGITISETQQWDVTPGTYSISELVAGAICEQIPGAVTGDFETLVKVSDAPIGANELDTLGTTTGNFSVGAGETVYVAFGNRDCSEVLSASNVIVRKFEDVNGDFDADDAAEGPLSGWTITITGTGGAATGFVASLPTDGSGVAAFLGVPDGTYTVSETPQGSHNVVGSTYSVGVAPADPTPASAQAGTSRAGLTVALDETLLVDFFNQPKGSITVIKVETDNVGAGNFTWEFLLTGCGVAKGGTIDGDGQFTWPNLDPCANYVVTETNANSDGFATLPGASIGVNLGPGEDESVTFTNRRDPGVTVTPTPETPTPETPTPETPTPETPTNTPESPTPTETEDTAGEFTPGPGEPTHTPTNTGNQATPIAPDSGSGIAGSSTGASLLLVLMGLAAITMGSGFLAIGRKRS